MDLIAWIAAGFTAGVVTGLLTDGKPQDDRARKYQLSFYDPNGRRVRMPINVFDKTLAQARYRARTELSDLPDGTYAIVAKTGGGKWVEVERVTSARNNPARRRAPKFRILE